jgi:hypothetical protein
MAENTLGLLGEIGSPDALPPLLEFCTSPHDDVAAPRAGLLAGFWSFNRSAP